MSWGKKIRVSAFSAVGFHISRPFISGEYHSCTRERSVSIPKVRNCFPLDLGGDHFPYKHLKIHFLWLILIFLVTLILLLLMINVKKISTYWWLLLCDILDTFFSLNIVRNYWIYWGTAVIIRFMQRFLKTFFPYVGNIVQLSNMKLC